jgi:uncharacterized membrane protein YidH (DUF202 family)
MSDERKIELAAKVGYFARGAIYLLVGGFAIDAAFGGGGQARGSRGSLLQLTDEPLGQVMLAAIALGLVGYTVWRFIQSTWDTDAHGTDAKGLAIRAGLLVSAFTHAALAVFVAQVLLGSGGGGSSGSRSDWVADILGVPAGQWIVAGIGLAIAGAGVAQVVKGWKRGYAKWMDMDARTRRWADPVCRFGLVARGVVFVIVASFFVTAAVQYDPQEAGGLTEALRAVQSSPFGGILFMLIALGLFAFGVYSILEGAYRRIQASWGSSLGDAAAPARHAPAPHAPRG